MSSYKSRIHSCLFLLELSLWLSISMLYNLVTSPLLKQFFVTNDYNMKNGVCCAEFFKCAIIKLLTCKYLKKCSCGPLNFAFNSSNDIRLLSLYRSCSVAMTLLNHVLKRMSFFAGVKRSLAQIGEKQDSTGESPKNLCTSCQTIIVFFKKWINSAFSLIS